MNSLAPETIDLSTLPSLPLNNRNELPHVSALYFVLNTQHNVLYIGQTISLRKRWHYHHRLLDFLEECDLHIAWLLVHEKRMLIKLEKACIVYFKPPINIQGLRSKSPTAPLSSAITQVLIPKKRSLFPPLSERRKPGPKSQRLVEKILVRIPPELKRWVDQQPEDASKLVRSLLTQERARRATAVGA